jgi:hypothetical protein
MSATVVGTSITIECSGALGPEVVGSVLVPTSAIPDTLVLAVGSGSIELDEEVNTMEK